MKNLPRFAPLALAAALAGGVPAPALAQTPSQATVAAHVEEAKRLAGEDLKALTGLCAPAPAARPSQAEVDNGIAAQIARTPPEPGKAFDNLYFVGSAWVSAWAIKTSDGIILIDALNNALEAGSLIEGGMRKLGLDPAQIKYVVVTHGHGDHYGGANYLVGKYHPRIVMSELDWKMTETRLEFASAAWGAPPKRDIAVADGDSITLGDTRVAFHLTPGHTLGTVSPVFDVKSGSATHRAMVWGGTAFNFGNNIPRLGSYIDATGRMSTLAQQQNVDVLLSNHPGYDGTVAKLDALRKQPAAANPFVLGVPTVQRSLAVMRECALATRDRFSL
ncbi:MAG: MBL fold metallo-hydrolase [Burkholderiales bacterium]|nr:MBL fold metallo-hydrolase [Burkholderiales bacterium]